MLLSFTYSDCKLFLCMKQLIQKRKYLMDSFNIGTAAILENRHRYFKVCLNKTSLPFSRELIKIFLFGELRVWKENVYGSLLAHSYDWQEKPTWMPHETSCSGTFRRVVNWCWHKHKKNKMTWFSTFQF